MTPWHLGREGYTAPSTSTIRRILHAAGLVVPEPRKCPRRLAWILPASLIAVVLVVGTSEPAIAIFYAVVAAAAATGLLLLERAAAPRA